MDYKLQGLIDVGKMKALLDNINDTFTSNTFTFGIHDAEGNILVHSGWKDVCAKFHRVNRETERRCIDSDRYIIERTREAYPSVMHKCPQGLIDFATPIMIEGMYLGSIIVGQLFLEPPNLDFFRGQARTYGFNEDAYIQAIRQVAVLPRDAMERSLAFFRSLTEMVAEAGLQRRKELETEETLREREEFYRSLLENSSDSIVVFDQENVIRYQSPSVERILGYRPGEALNKKRGSVIAIHPEDVSRARSISEQAISNPGVTVGPIEIRLRHKNGSWRWVETVYKAGKNRAGEIVVVLNSRDITERKKVEDEIRQLNADLERRIKERTAELSQTNEQLRSEIAQRTQMEIALLESEERYRSMFKNSHAVMLLIDPSSGAIVDANPAACLFYGYEYGKLLSLKITDINRLSHEQVRAEMERARKEERAYFSFPHRLSNGQTRDVEVYSGPVSFAGKQMLYSIIHDTTERKRAEEALRDSEERFRALVESTCDLVWEVDRDGKYTYVSPKVNDILGYEPEEVLGRTLFDLMPPEEAEKMAFLFGKIFAARKPLIQLENVNLRKTGEAVILETSGEPIYNKAGDVIGYRGIDRDITERKKTAEEQERLIGALQEALAKIKTLRGMLPICSSCKKIRDDKGYWTQIELYVREHSEAEFSHSLCPECAQKLYPGFRKG